MGLTLLLVTAPLEAAAPVRVACGACEQADRFVRLQKASSHAHQNNAPAFTHPLQLDAEEWRSLLLGIHIQERNPGWLIFAAPKSSTSRAFTGDEVDYLSETLPRAFAQAQPDEWVVFGLSHTTIPDVAGFTEFTTGAWFAQGGSLHLILANYREGVTMPGIRDMLQEDPLHMVAAPRYEFVPGHHQNVQPENGGLNTFLFPELPELILAYYILIREEHEQLIAPQSGSGSGNSSISSPTIPQSIEERLQRLKHLKEQGLITEDDYQMKKMQILQSF